MKVLAIYDITDNRFRNRVARKCKDFGLKRIQKSCFAGDMSLNKIEMLNIELNNLLAEKEAYDVSEYDAIYVLPLCETCFAKKTLMGYKGRFPDKDRDKLKFI
ncbi:MAG: CRISPR-associated endonuclease Cas2 [Candidatus Hadarchaeaceae archaeon]